ncbi:hypothetical protein [Streptomyces sp. NPDC008139]|uniref:hypothetical protein n=1 Tax=Streptomyces sp. NPDC008139 TaxID=3364814 RepID=UPI0036EEDF47
MLHSAGSLQVQRRLRALLDTLAASVPRSSAAMVAACRAMLDHAAADMPDPAMTPMTPIATTPEPQGLGGPASRLGR